MGPGTDERGGGRIRATNGTCAHAVWQTTPLTPPVRRFFTEPREPKADASDDEEQEQDDGDEWTVEDDGAEDKSQGEGATDGAESLCDALRTLELAPTGSFLRGVPRACGTHVRFDD